MLSMLLASSAIAVISWSASSAVLPYRFSIMDLGVLPGALGLPITWSGPGDNRAFTAGAGSSLPPPADQIDSIPRLRWDDYFMADPLGASNGGDPGVPGDGYTAAAAFFAGEPANFQAGRAVGVTFAVGPDGIGGTPAGPDGRVYLMNLTLRVGSGVPVTEGVTIGILREGASVNEPILRAVRFGIENATNVTLNPGQFSQRRYYLDYIATPVPASELPASFGAGINYQIFVAQTDVPTPATSILLLTASSWATRRRRR
jgi:hypothetical protein